MTVPESKSAEIPRWSKRTGRFIDLLCLLALLAVMGAVIYGFFLRAIWAHSYFIAVALAMIGAVTILIGIAQQTIAARDAGTWREMAEWQIRSAKRKIGAAKVGSDVGGQLDPDSPHYYEHLVEALLEDVQRSDGEAYSR